MLSITARTSRPSETLSAVVFTLTDLDAPLNDSDAQEPEYKADFDDVSCLESAIELEPDQIVPCERGAFLPLTSESLQLVEDAIVMVRTTNITPQQAQALQSQYKGEVRSVASMSSLTDSWSDALEEVTQVCRNIQLRSVTTTANATVPYDGGHEIGQGQWSAPSGARSNTSSMGDSAASSWCCDLFSCLPMRGFNNQ